MSQTILFASFFFLIVAISTISSSPVEYESALRLKWGDWKAMHGKNYRHDAEEEERSKVWMENKKYIDAHNESTGYTLRMNKFGDLTDQEWQDMFLSKQTRNISKLNTRVFKSTLRDYPVSFDWRSNNAVTPVKDQRKCNASYAFAVVGAMEGASALVHEKLVPLSEQNIIDCAVPYGNHGCNGGDMYNSFQYIISEGGIDADKTYKYKGKQGQCRYNADLSEVDISGVVSIEHGNEHDLLGAVATVGPIAISVDASSNGFRFYDSGIFDSIHCSSTDLNHNMLITGYGVVNGKKFWLVKNSWGISWGSEGYILMVRDSYNQCGIASNALYPTL